ncbi:hypothetical protein K440DRAFT_664538 [Wilcoxina mikolae CBS 423.85]|nr:hypothetical protein K440DRAFT_664538 [Wilcoxina mikolae CBS 423.85]
MAAALQNVRRPVSWTFRISSIPPEVTEHQLQTYLEAVFGGEPHSFTLYLVPCNKRQMATVTFDDRVPQQFPENGRYYPKDRRMEESVVDSNFYGMTSLYSAAEPTVEARILVYGYESALKDSTSTSSIQQFSRQLLDAVNSIRSEKEKERYRPIIFIGHSLGGLIIKFALADAGMQEPPPKGSGNDQAILKACMGLFFFGVPHKGLNGTNLSTLVKGQRNVRFVDDLQEGSEFLRLAYNNFLRGFKFKDCQTTSFYETDDTPTLTIVERDGRRFSDRNNEVMVRMVTQDSATWASPNEALHDQVPINRDHSNLVKSFDNADPHFVAVRDRLLDCVQAAPSVFAKRGLISGKNLVIDRNAIKDDVVPSKTL